MLLSLCCYYWLSLSSLSGQINPNGWFTIYCCEKYLSIFIVSFPVAPTIAVHSWLYFTPSFLSSPSIPSNLIRLTPTISSHSHPSFCLIPSIYLTQWASYQICKIAGCACAWNAGKCFPHHRLQRKPLVSDPGMHHGTCVTHVPWCRSGLLTLSGGENVPGIPSACATRNFTYLERGPLIPSHLIPSTPPISLDPSYDFILSIRSHPSHHIH